MAEKRFHPSMTIGEAMQMHPRAREVFFAFHLGGCSHCSINELETIEQVCYGYGVPVEELISTLNGLLEKDDEEETEGEATETATADETTDATPETAPEPAASAAPAGETETG